MFNEVPKDFDAPSLEAKIFDFWEQNQIERRYLERNRDAEERFSFLDGPITANGNMAVHHVWGRTYKDLWQRYNTMLGKRQRYQNGFDCQGLWVEVDVERKLGFGSKRDIEEYGIAEFVRKCKESVFAYADNITRASRRLGYFMDWDNSYYTLSDENNYTIWHFLKRCHESGLLYQGHDVMPWCTRCGTGLSDHELLEGYKDLTHQSVFVRFPLLDRPGEELLVWTTTPWTLTSNVAVAVNPDLTYSKVRQQDRTYYLAKGAQAILEGAYEVTTELRGSELLGWRYCGPFDEIPSAEGAQHVVIPWEDVAEDEGTGLVHIAPGCGKEDFALGKEHGLAVIDPIDQNGVYREGFGWLSGRSVQGVSSDIVEDLKRKGILYRSQRYRHRYPTCWRCGTELVFRLVDEWFISMAPLRQPMMDVVRKIHWIPGFCEEREIDWLRNMDDWMISKKRYWGLALPFWVCASGHLQVIGGKDELFEKAVGDVSELESPHRPWIDEFRIPCPECGQLAERIQDVGNPWLDAGIVPFSTLRYASDPEYWSGWFPANFITESFPGQFRNWFYSLLAMSTVLENTNPFQTVLGYALVRAQDGREMHKSWGNAIAFEEATQRSGVDVMRWAFARHAPESNISFGWESLDEVKRQLLTLWNTYKFFITYANLDGWTPADEIELEPERSLLDRWILARLNQLTAEIRAGLDDFDAVSPARAIELFIDDLSTWYVRRSRSRFWKSENDRDKDMAYATLYECLTVLCRLIAPFMPFLAETLYQNLVRAPHADASLSVHLADYPQADKSLIEMKLVKGMEVAKRIVSLGRAAREKENIQVRQPLGAIFVGLPNQADEHNVRELEDIILEELNVKSLHFAATDDEYVTYSVRPNFPLLAPRYGKQLPDIRAALLAMPATEIAAMVQRGESVHLAMDGQEIELRPEDVLVEARKREGYAAMASDGYLVALDTQLTRPLILEGLARQVIRRINDWRKAAGFNIDDRIVVRYQASRDVAEAIAEHYEYVSQETLAASLAASEPSGQGFEAEKSTFGDQWLQVELQRAA